MKVKLTMPNTTKEEAQLIYGIYARVRKEKNHNRNECYTFCEIMQQHGYTPVFAALMYHLIQTVREEHKQDLAERFKELFD